MKSPESVPQILVVDDEAELRDLLIDILRGKGYATVAAANGYEALAAMEQQPIDLVLSDVRMPKMSGLELMAEMSRRGHNAPVILISAYGDLNVVRTALHHGLFDFIEKPFDDDFVEHRVEAALEHVALRKLEHEIFSLLAKHFDISLPQNLCDLSKETRRDHLRNLLSVLKLRLLRVESQMKKAISSKS